MNTLSSLCIFFGSMSILGCTSNRENNSAYSLIIETNSDHIEVVNSKKETILQEGTTVNGLHKYKLKYSKDFIMVSVYNFHELKLDLFQIEGGSYEVIYEPHGRLGGVHLGPYRQEAPYLNVYFSYSDKDGFNTISMKND